MMPGRFFLGLGTGENLNEHVVGEGWPNITVRREMLDEAIKVIRGLWTGELFEHRGPYYTVEDARIYTLPDEPPPIYIAASGEESAKFAGEVGDGYIATAPKREFVQAFERGGGGKPKYGQITVCYAADEASARKTAHEVWPNAAIPGELSVELPLPRHYEQASKNVTEDDVAKLIVCGPDPSKHIEKIREYEQAGYDHVYIHQVGPDQEGFFRFYREHILPELTRNRRTQAA
jgi:G6PDH family F420-dependent oxidoreductase